MYKLMRTLFSVILLLPTSFFYGVSNVLYFLGYRIFKYRQSVVIQNLARSFPEKKYEEIEQIAKQFYRNFFDLLIENVLLAKWSSEEVRDRMQVGGLDVLEQYYEQGRTIIATMGHCGDWEFFNILSTYLKVPMVSGYKPLHNPAINRWVEETRTRFGTRLVPSKLLARTILASRNSSEKVMYVLIGDQIPKTIKEAHKIDFLHQPTAFFTGPEKLAKAIDAVVVHFDMERVGRGRYKSTCTLVTDTPQETAPNEITTRFAHLIEKNILEHPSDWLWSHRRWKR